MSEPRSPLLVTRCDSCNRRRANAFIQLLSGRWYALCRQCLRALMPRITKALRAFKEQGR